MVAYARTATWRCAVYCLILCHLILRVKSQNNEGRQALDKEDVKILHAQEDATLRDKDAEVKKNEAISRTNEANLGFTHAFVASISVIIVSEIGDKTFFIAAILAMKHSRCIVFTGAIAALGLMTFLSVCLGFATMIIPRAVTFFVCTALLAVFGVKMLYDGWKMSPDEGKEEFEEVSAELQKTEGTPSPGQGDVEGGGAVASIPLRRRLRFLGPLISPIFIQAFTLTFLAEWGDRSQITTIILAARENPVGVTLGGTTGHALCTALAVIGGNIVAQRISVRSVTIIGGLVFLVFAFTALFHDPDSGAGISS